MSSPGGTTFLRASPSRNMSTSPTPSSIATRPGWSMRCSTGWRNGSGRRISGGDGVPRPSEDALIARYFAPLASHAGADGLRDDAALFTPPPGASLVLTTDALVAGVHFLSDDPPETIARKALRVNLSDLAAKGATPAGFVLTLALRQVSDAWLAPFARGLGEDAKLFGCALLGGDTVSTRGPTMISITAFGRTPAGRMIRRHGAQPGDRVVVTGTIGDAALGLDVLQAGPVAAALAGDAAG